MEATRTWVASLRLVKASRARTEVPTNIREARDVYKFMVPFVEQELVEIFWVIPLNSQHQASAPIVVTQGILNSSLVHPREVFRGLIHIGAYATILVHNHPSGDPTPSAEDRAVTTQLVSAGKLLGIDVLDHIIVGQGRFSSMAESGILI